MNRAQIAVWGFAFAGVACHASESTSSGTEAGSGAAVSPVTPNPPAAEGVVDVCAALSAADMAEASGRPIVKTEKGTLSECTYKSNEAIRLEYIVRVGVLHGIHIGGSKQDAPNYMKVSRATDGVHRFAPAVEVPGLGDEAILITFADAKTPKEIDSIAVLARKGDSIVELLHARGIDPERVAETAKKALPKVLAAL